MDRSISKRHTQALQGLAVLMMLFHHFFQKPENLTLLYFFNADMCMRIAWLCKLCVTIFAFLSGYGMNFGQDSNKKPDLKSLYKKSAVRILRLYSLLWLVIIVFKTGEIIVSRIMVIPPEITIIPFNLPEFIGNMLGVVNTYNGSWWYVLFYVIICLLFPIIRVLLSKAVPIRSKAVLCLSFAVIAVGLRIAADHILFPYLFTGLMYLIVALHPPILLAFILGVLVSEYALFDRILSFINMHISGSPVKCFLFRFLIPVAVVAMLAIARIKIAPSAAYCTWDFIMSPLMVLCYLIVVRDYVPRVLYFFGSFSTAMWLTHVSLMGYVYFPVARLTRFVPTFYLAMVVITLIVSFTIQYVLTLLVSFIVPILTQGLSKLISKVQNR